MKVSTEIDNNFGYEKITQLVDNIPLNESLNTINKGNGNKVSSVGIIVFHVEAAYNN